MIYVDETIPWIKHAKQRPRNGKGRTYTPTVTKNAEKFLRARFLEIVGADFQPIDVPIGVSLALRKDDIDLTIHAYKAHEHRSLSGDIDNYSKTILDALNGVAWVDDKQIERLFVVKQ